MTRRRILGAVPRRELDVTTSPNEPRTTIPLLQDCQGLIRSLDQVPPPPHIRACDPARQHMLAAELTGWVATAKPRGRNLRVTVVIPDETRPITPGLVLPPVLESLMEVSYRTRWSINVTVLVATGLHAAPSQPFLDLIEQALRPFRSDRALNARWEIHDARAVEAIGLPLHPLVVNATNGGETDCVVTISVVEPHQYAGFSGGLKAISVGCGSLTTIAAIHSLHVLRQPGVDIGRIKDNPFRQTLDAIAAAHAAPVFAISLVPSPTAEGIVGLFAGNTNHAFLNAVRMAQRLLVVPVSRRYDFALIGVPASKATNFYQASRALTYLALHPNPCIHPGGTLVIQAACPDGFGQGDGEQMFRRALGRGQEQLLAELAGDLAPPEAGGGAQRAWVLARALSRFRCILVGAPDLPEARAAGLTQVDTLDAVRLSGHGLVVDDPFVALPFFGETEARAAQSDHPTSPAG